MAIDELAFACPFAGCTRTFPELWKCAAGLHVQRLAFVLLFWHELSFHTTSYSTTFRSNVLFRGTGYGRITGRLFGVRRDVEATERSCRHALAATRRWRPCCHIYVSFFAATEMLSKRALVWTLEPVCHRCVNGCCDGPNCGVQSM